MKGPQKEAQVLSISACGLKELIMQL